MSQPYGYAGQPPYNAGYGQGGPPPAGWNPPPAGGQPGIDLLHFTFFPAMAVLMRFTPSID